MFKLGDKFKDNGKGYPNRNMGKIMTVDRISGEYYCWYDTENKTVWHYFEDEMEKVDA